MFTKTKIAFALLGSMLAAGGVALAHPGSGFDKGAILQKYDTNKDGKLDDQEKAAMRADFQAKRQERKAEMLARFDLNKDGKLDEQEKAAMKDELATERFKKIDTNGDGVISLQEFKAAKPLMHRHARRGEFRGRKL